MDTAKGYGETRRDFTFDAKRNLLGVRILVPWLTVEDYRQQRKRTRIGDRDPELREVSRCDTGGRPRCGRPAGDLALPKKRLENTRRKRRRRRRIDSKRRTRRADSRRCQQIRNLPRIVDIPQSLNHISNLAIDLGIEDSEPAANYSLAILEGIPGKRHARGKVIFVAVQGTILRIQFVAETVVQRKVVGNLPGVLPVQRGERPWVVIVGIAKALLIELWHAEGSGLNRVDRGRIHTGSKSAVGRRNQTRAEQVSRQRAKDEASREKRV